MSGRSPFKSMERDERAWPVIRHYLETYGVDSGYEKLLPGFDGHALANEGRKSVSRGARHHGVRPAAWVVGPDGISSCNPADAPCSDPAAPHGVRFTLWSPATANRYVARKSGGDPRNLTYNPFVRGQRRYEQQRPRHLRDAG